MLNHSSETFGGRAEMAEQYNCTVVQAGPATGAGNTPDQEIRISLTDYQRSVLYWRAPSRARFAVLRN